MFSIKFPHFTLPTAFVQKLRLNLKFSYSSVNVAVSFKSFGNWTFPGINLICLEYIQIPDHYRLRYLNRFKVPSDTIFHYKRSKRIPDKVSGRFFSFGFPRKWL